ncbi:hypothetical protein HK102_007781, partial [Quaeritorhiza haematococci]
MATGKYQFLPPLPFVPGAEFAGIVVEVGPQCEGFKRGDRVFGSVIGSFATKVAVPQASKNLRQASDFCGNLTFEELAAIYFNYPTAWAALYLRGHMKPGDVVLVHAAAGGVGSAAVQIAKQGGAKVIAVVSEKKVSIARDLLHADAVVVSGPSWTKDVKDVCKKWGRKGVDVVVDMVGRIDESMKIVAWDARIVVVGFAGSKIEKILANKILLKNIAVTGLYWGQYAVHDPVQVDKAFQFLSTFFETQKPVICKSALDEQGAEFRTLEDIPRALKDVMGGKTY